MCSIVGRLPSATAAAAAAAHLLQELDEGEDPDGRDHDHNTRTSDGVLASTRKRHRDENTSKEKGTCTRSKRCCFGGSMGHAEGWGGGQRGKLGRGCGSGGWCECRRRGGGSGRAAAAPAAAGSGGGSILERPPAAAFLRPEGKAPALAIVVGEGSGGPRRRPNVRLVSSTSSTVIVIAVLSRAMRATGRALAGAWARATMARLRVTGVKAEATQSIERKAKMTRMVDMLIISAGGGAEGAGRAVVSAAGAP